MKPAEAVVEVLRSEGVDRVFGNPGTTELPFLDALVAAGDLPYVLALHEGSLVATADAFARVTRRTAFVSLHVAAGLANGLIGMLNARRSRTPLVVTAGQQDRRHLLQEPMLGGDLVGLAAAASKSAVEVTRVEDVVPVLRRAFALASTPPAGPVFVSLPMDLFDEQVDLEVDPPLPRDLLLASSHVTEAATLLRRASSPAIVAGDGVGRAGAVAELVAVAESLGAVVHHQPMHDGVNIPMSHPLHAGMLPPTNEASRTALEGRDVVLLVGARFWPHHYSEGPPLPPAATLVQIDDEGDQIGRPCPVDVALGGGIRTNLRALAAALGSDDRGARRRNAAVERVNLAMRTKVAEEGAAAAGSTPLSPLAAAHVIGANLPESATLVEEAITLGVPLRRALRIDRPGHYLHTVGGGLGWGIGAAVGVGLGRPGLPVVAAVGDGSAAFGVHGLWTAARQGVPILVVVANNGEYRTLKQTSVARGGAASVTETYLGMDLRAPRLDWPAIARGFGVAARQVTSGAELAELVRDVDHLEEPLLIDLEMQSYAQAARA
jgi:benzoylformate decarboxylase